MSIFAPGNRTLMGFLYHMSQDNIGIFVDESEMTRYIRILSETIQASGYPSRKKGHIVPFIIVVISASITGDLLYEESKPHLKLL